MRKTKRIVVQPTLDGKNRDAGKTFEITEMSAVRAEKWATRALSAMMNSGANIPVEVVQLGMGALAAVGLQALLVVSFAEAEPLLDEMLQCVEILPDPKNPAVRRPFDPDDIEEVSTILLLRSEVFEIHTGFSIAGFLSTLGKSATTGPTLDTLNAPTSPPQSPA